MASQASNVIKYLLWKKVIDGENDTFKIALMADGFSFNRASHATYGDISSYEHTAGNGYTAGGATLTGVSVTQDDTYNAGIISWNNASWNMSGGNLATVGAIVYDDSVGSPVNKPIVGFIDFQGLLTTYDGNTFTVANIAIPIT